MKHESRYNPETRRGAMVVGFGIAVYKCKIEDGVIVGTRYGMVQHAADADLWLGGSEPQDIPTLITAHPSEFITEHVVTIQGEQDGNRGRKAPGQTPP